MKNLGAKGRTTGHKANPNPNPKYRYITHRPETSLNSATTGAQDTHWQYIKIYCGTKRVTHEKSNPNRNPNPNHRAYKCWYFNP